MADAQLLQAVEIAQEVLPFLDEAGLAREVVEMLIDSARKEQKTCPRMAASEEWKIGRVRMIALVLRKSSEERLSSRSWTI